GHVAGPQIRNERIFRANIWNSALHPPLLFWKPLLRVSTQGGRVMDSRALGAPATDSGHRKAGTWTQALAVFVAGLTFYVSLYGELPYHDVERFAGQVESGHFVWDIAHIFLQPATLLWHQYLGFGESAEMSQKHINSVAMAAALAVFY